MKMTIIREDNLVIIDGIAVNTVDTSSLDKSIHAIQWNNDHGEIEIKDLITEKIIENRAITSIDEYQSIIDSYNVIKLAKEQEEQAKADQLLQSMQAGA